MGEMLAQSLRYAFFDTDALVETASGASVSEVFATIGKDEFRKLETNVCENWKGCVTCVSCTRIMLGITKASILAVARSDELRTVWG